MVYLTGDCHGDFRRFSTSIFPEQKEMTRNDFVIILGDFGGIWSNSKEEKYWLDWLNNKPFTTLFVDGNHEGFNLLSTFSVVDFCGGKAHKITDNIYHLMRGYVFDICDKKFFAFGGASSHDIQDGILDPKEFETKGEFKRVYNSWRKHNKMFRVKGVSWWEEELPSEEEMKRGIQSLEDVNYEVDYVITHCLPQDVSVCIGCMDGDYLTQYFNDLLLINGLKFNKWYCGHYHCEKQIFGKFNILYEKIVRIV